MTIKPARLHLRSLLAVSASQPAAGLRKMTRSDIPELGKVFHAAYEGTVDHEGESELEATAVVAATFDGQFGLFMEEASMVLEREGRILSASFITEWQGRPLLAFAVTDPWFKGRGLSRTCTAAAMQTLARAGHRELDLFVTATNAPALALYRRLGFAAADGMGRRSALLAAALCSAGASRPAQGAGHAPLQRGLVLRPERGSEGFPYAYHAPTGQWVGQEIQLAVPVARPLPEPLVVPGRSPHMEVLLFGGLSIESAAVVGGVGNRQIVQLPSLGDWYWWWINRSIGDVELRRRQRLGVQVLWPAIEGGAAQGPRAEAMEVFDLPAIDAQPLNVWTPWRRADAVVGGADASLQVAKGSLEAAAAPLPALAFELRCRAAAWDSPVRRQR